MRRTIIAIAAIAAFGAANMVLWTTLATSASAYSCQTICTGNTCFTQCF
jgi:hypothetical protein